MKEEDFNKCKEAMEEAGRDIMEERPDFCFGEWAGESTSEIIYMVTGYDIEDFTQEEVEELVDTFLEG